MPRTPVHTSQLTEFASSLQPEHAKDDAVVSRRAGYAAFGWVLAFLAWHVVWAVTGLRFPHHDWSGTARMLMWGFDAVIYVMVAVGIVLPLALARRWGRRVPRRMLLRVAWTGCALLGAPDRRCRRRRGARDRVLPGAHRDDDRTGDGHRASLGLAVVRRPATWPCHSG
jgi:hypothetical protein